MQRGPLWRSAGRQRRRRRGATWSTYTTACWLCTRHWAMSAEPPHQVRPMCPSHAFTTASPACGATGTHITLSPYHRHGGSELHWRQCGAYLPASEHGQPRLGEGCRRTSSMRMNDVKARNRIGEGGEGVSPSASEHALPHEALCNSCTLPVKSVSRGAGGWHR